MRIGVNIQEEKQMIDGKPHFGVWIGNYIWINGDAFVGDPNKNPMLDVAKQLLHNWLKNHYKEVEHRHTQIVERPPYYSELSQRGTVGIKAMIWGRAYKVMRHFRKGKVRYKKTRAGGRIKWRKIKNQ